jgi:hypothetical protein
MVSFPYLLRVMMLSHLWLRWLVYFCTLNRLISAWLHRLFLSRSCNCRILYWCIRSRSKEMPLFLLRGHLEFVDLILLHDEKVSIIFRLQTFMDVFLPLIPNNEVLFLDIYPRHSSFCTTCVHFVVKYLKPTRDSWPAIRRRVLYLFKLVELLLLMFWQTLLLLWPCRKAVILPKKAWWLIIAKVTWASCVTLILMIQCLKVRLMRECWVIVCVLCQNLVILVHLKVASPIESKSRR